MTSLSQVKDTSRRDAARVSRQDRRDDAYAALAPIDKLNIDLQRVVTLKARPQNWTHLELAGNYRLRVQQEDLASFHRAFAGQPTEGDWQDFLLNNAEARISGEWMPMPEALRLDDEAATEQEEAA